MKLGLGTVQFGLNYGINNTTGQPGLSQIKQTLQLAEASGISVLDTAADYGESETNLGLSLPPVHAFKVVTKLSKKGSAAHSLETSLRRLRCKKVYGVLLHDFQQYENAPFVWNELATLKKNGLCEKIGFSLYLPDQLETVLDLQPSVDLVQVPYSVLDQRFEKHFPKLRERGVEIHVRSVFVQGLVFRAIHSLQPFFDPVKPKLIALNEISLETGKSIESLCLNFVHANPYVDSLIVGVDSPDNLAQNVSVLKDTLSESTVNRLRALKESDEQMILPYNWKLK